MQIKCPECGFGNPDNTQYCGKCGTRFESPEKIPVSQTQTFVTPVKEFVRGILFADRYKVIEKLGHGGMGTVYKALDREIEEEVALKLLNPEISADEKTIKRFRNELKYARKISHKNVCRMFHLGAEGETRYITMEYVEGEDLKSVIKQKGRLSEDEVLRIAKQLCDGLSEAHRLGIVHRDMKPHNIMIDRNGDAKIMDFGISRSLEAKGVTESGMIIGTPDYMSPEQVEGEEADKKSDIYSFGVILYEMVTGQVPFRGKTSLSVAFKHKTEKPPSPRDIDDKVSEGLSSLILKCMEKNRKKRFQSTKELLLALRNTEKGIPITDRIPPQIMPEPEALTEIQWKNSIAVLPFADLSPQKDQEYFCDGMTEDIITKLSRAGELKVISRTSVMRYKKIDKDIKEIGRELAVATILEGSIRKEKNNIRVTAQLINVEDGFHLWADTYDRRLESVFEVQDDVSKAIAEALEIKLTPKALKAFKSGRPKNIEAYEYLLKGMHLINSKYVISQRDVDFNAAMKMFHKAIEIDQNYALAYTGLCWGYQHRFQITGNNKDLDRVIKIAETTYKIDPNLAETNAITAWVYYLRGEYEKSYKTYKKAIEINPNFPTVYHIIALFYRSLGLLHQAIKYSSRSTELDPFYLLSHSLRARCLIYNGEHDKAVTQIEKSFEIEPENFWSHLDYSLLFIMKKKYDKAEEFLSRAEKINPKYSSVRFYKALLLATKGEKDKALSLIKNAAVYSLLGMKDEAIKNITEKIQKDYEHFQYTYLPLMNNHFYDSLRDDPRFQKILKAQKKKYEERLKKFGDL